MKKGCKIIRDNFAPDPTEALGIFGKVGKIIGFLFNFLISKPVHWLIFKFVGAICKKGKHPAWVGSVLYTLIFLLAMGLMREGISLLIK